MTSNAVGPIGNRYLADLGALVVELSFDSATQLTFTIKDGGGLSKSGYTETVDTTMSEVAPGVYLTAWQEKSGATVTHIEDFRRGTLHSHATLPDGRFFAMTGSISPLVGDVERSGGRAENAASSKDERLANKQVVRRAMHELFELGDLTALDRYWVEPYVQHSPQLPDGLDALRAAVPTLRAFPGLPRGWWPKRISSSRTAALRAGRPRRS